MILEIGGKYKYRPILTDSQAYEFNVFAHAGLGDTTTTEDLHCVTGSFLSASRDVHLQKTDRTVKSVVRNSSYWK